jgi:hypothetical protein
METDNGFHLIFMTESPFEGEGSSAEMIRDHPIGSKPYIVFIFYGFWCNL